MTQAIVKEINTFLANLDMEEERDQKMLKNFMKGMVSNGMNTDVIYKKTREIILKGEKITEEDKNYLAEKLGYVDDYDKNHSLLCFTEKSENKRFAMADFTNSLIEEYKCDTPSEKTLCELIACNYFEKLRLTNYLSSELDTRRYLCHESNGYITALSKSIDRADRGYINALHTLREIKSPNLNIHIKTNTAIIGTNQQFNNNLHADEIIEG